MKYYITFIILLNVWLAQSYVKRTTKNTNKVLTPAGIAYVGIGYDLLKGNPDGSPTTGHSDPGFRGTYKIFNFTFNDNKQGLPDQISYIPSQSCVKTSQQEMYSTEYAYAKKFDLDVSFSGEATFKFLTTKFSQSSYYSRASSKFKSESHVTFEKVNYCYKGKARYQTELASVNKYSLTKSFVTTINDLPTTYTNHESSYMDFIQKFGTHVVTDIFLGTKSEDRYYWTGSEFVKTATTKYASSSSLGVGVKGYSASISIDTSSVVTDFNKHTSTSSRHESKTLGDASLALPYAYTLMSMDEVFEARFWQLHQHYVDSGYLSADFYGRLSDMKSNMRQALTDYPDSLGTVEAKKDLYFRLPITWPIGFYGLPRPSRGCPGDITNRYTFFPGSRYHDTEDIRNKNKQSPNNNFPSGSVGRNIRQYFCMKTLQKFTLYDRNWPEGKYCVYKAKSRGCPTGMNAGWIRWDDEDRRNDNSYEGSVPDGTYNKDTVIRYCCQEKGFAENPIYLPTDSPFYLFPLTKQCQKVEGMTDTLQWIYFDTQNFNTKNGQGWPHPFRRSYYTDHIVYQCYYTPK